MVSLFMQLLGNLRFVKDKILKCEDTKNMNYLKLHNKIDFKLHKIQKTATISFKKNEIDNFRV